MAQPENGDISQYVVYEIEADGKLEIRQAASIRWLGDSEAYRIARKKVDELLAAGKRAAFAITYINTVFEPNEKKELG